MKTERTYNAGLRSEHFIAAVHKQLHGGKKPFPIGKLCAMVAASPAPQFYVAPKRALEMYNLYRKTGRIIPSSERHLQMYLEIFRRYDEMMASMQGAFKYSVMQDVLEQPAPSFYIEPSGATEYYYRAMAARRRRNRNK